MIARGSSTRVAGWDEAESSTESEDEFQIPDLPSPAGTEDPTGRPGNLRKRVKEKVVVVDMSTQTDTSTTADGSSGGYADSEGGSESQDFRTRRFSDGLSSRTSTSSFSGLFKSNQVNRDSTLEILEAFGLEDQDEDPRRRRAAHRRRRHDINHGYSGYGGEQFRQTMETWEFNRTGKSKTASRNSRSSSEGSEDRKKSENNWFGGLLSDSDEEERRLQEKRKEAADRKRKEEEENDKGIFGSLFGSENATKEEDEKKENRRKMRRGGRTKRMTAVPRMIGSAASSETVMRRRGGFKRRKRRKRKPPKGRERKRKRRIGVYSEACSLPIIRLSIKKRRLQRKRTMQDFLEIC